MLRIEDKQLIELLRPLGAVFEHRAHGGIAINIGVLTLDIVILCVFKGEPLVDFHQASIHLSHTGALRTVQNIDLCGAGMSIFDENLLHRILDLLHRRFLDALFLQIIHDLIGQGYGLVVILSAHRLRSLKNCICNLFK